MVTKSFPECALVLVGTQRGITDHDYDKRTLQTGIAPCQNLNRSRI